MDITIGYTENSRIYIHDCPLREIVKAENIKQFTDNAGRCYVTGAARIGGIEIIMFSKKRKNSIIDRIEIVKNGE